MQAGNVTLLEDPNTGAVTAVKPITVQPSLYTEVLSNAVVSAALFEGTACVSIALSSTGANLSGLLATYTNISAASVGLS